MNQNTTWGGEMDDPTDDLDSLDSCECPHCYADAFRKKGSPDDFVCAGCHHRFPWAERSTRLTPYSSRLVDEIADQADIIANASITRDALIRKALRTHTRTAVIAQAAGMSVEAVEEIRARM
ncbi:hypothetical protein IU449_28510 [Nocardia higoensis]|uniref:Uncharacterized protein n=1 Tax=Nocardia higoensis TaxID=228599 RepID=A0ABS0DKJ2_9NOCA|nr:hypothetical protein [Nocardia higoensis]MBF6358443.1 hypothetical protein [Nocardia higoensis]